MEKTSACHSLRCFNSYCTFLHTCPDWAMGWSCQSNAGTRDNCVISRWATGLSDTTAACEEQHLFVLVSKWSISGPHQGPQCLAAASPSLLALANTFFHPSRGRRTRESIPGDSLLQQGSVFLRYPKLNVRTCGLGGTSSVTSASPGRRS